jgi:hypothetical protein
MFLSEFAAGRDGRQTKTGSSEHSIPITRRCSGALWRVPIVRSDIEPESSGLLHRATSGPTHDVAKLQTLYLQGATRAEVAAAFPRLTQCQICSKAGHLRLVRARRIPYVLGIPPLDEIRKQAALRGWTLRKLDKMAKTGRYFQQTTRRVDWDQLAKAGEMLGGIIEITWLSE